MNSFAKRAGIAVLPLFLLAACESEEEKAARMQQAQDITETSLQRCDLQEEFSQSVSYEDRLLSVLSNVRKGTLNEIENADATICLDHRLSQVEDNYGARQHPRAIFYPEQNLVSLATNGQDVFYGSNFLKGYNQDSAENTDDLQMGVRYRQYSAATKTMRTRYRWKDDAQDYQALQDNPELLTPPLAN